MKKRRILKNGDTPKLIVYEEKDYLGNGLFQSHVEVCTPENKLILQLEGGLEKSSKVESLYGFRKTSHNFEVFENGFVVNETCESIVKKSFSGPSTAKGKYMETSTAYDYSGKPLATIPNRENLSDDDVNAIINNRIKETGGRNF